MSGEIDTLENSFYKWLSGQVSPVQLSNMYEALNNIDEYCTSRRILKQSIFTTTNLNVLLKVQETVEKDQVFGNIYKRQKKLMAQAIEKYLMFIMSQIRMTDIEDDANVPLENQDTKEEEPLNDVLTRKLSDEQIPFVDLRSEGGCLWIIGGMEYRHLIVQLRGFGAKISYKGNGSKETNGKPAWWTKNVINKLPKENNSSQNVMSESESLQNIKETRQGASSYTKNDYLKWLREEGYSEDKAKFLVFVANKCGEFASKRKILNTEFFSITKRSEFKEFRFDLKSNSDFMKWDKKNRGKCIEAIDSYYKYLIDSEGKRSDYARKLEPVDSAETSTVEKETADLSEFLKEDIYEPLRNALYSQGITTVDQLKEIKLWPFMNRYNLYSIAMRQTVLERVRTKLRKDDTAIENGYTICYEENEYSGASWAECYLHFCEELARRYPLKFRSLIGRKMEYDGPVIIYRDPYGGHSLKLYNLIAYVPEKINSEEVEKYVKWLCKMCMGYEPAFSFKGPENEREVAVSINTVAVEHNQRKDQESQTNTGVSITDKLSSYELKEIERLENCVFEADIDGITYEDLKNKVYLSVAETKRFVKLSRKILEVKRKVYHEDALIDWNEGAERLNTILEKLMHKNNGYVSAAQLYEYASVELRMFLNDNDMNDERSVYEIAQHMYEDGYYNGKKYVFTGKMHISYPGSTINNNFDIFCKFAEDEGGVFKYSDLIEYLEKIDIKTGNLRTQLRLYSDPVFFYYQEGVLISAKSMGINEEWKESLKSALDKLFDDVGDHIILRDIQNTWFEQLPELPGNYKWTPLLLQSILRFYGEELNAKTIIAMDTQGIDTLHTMLVQLDSPIQNFGDVVVSYLIENDIEQRSFEAEELRGLLVESGMIHGNELIYNMSKALGGDERFSWDIEGKNVKIRV